jgi:hypothetical protein
MRRVPICCWDCLGLILQEMMGGNRMRRRSTLMSNEVQHG